MLISAGLASAKIIIGLHAGSTATVSDGIESASDVLTSGLVLLGLIIAAKPPDNEHPYGHGRLETISALVVGMVLAAGRLHRDQVRDEYREMALRPQDSKLRPDRRRLERYGRHSLWIHRAAWL